MLGIPSPRTVASLLTAPLGVVSVAIDAAGRASRDLAAIADAARALPALEARIEAQLSALTLDVGDLRAQMQELPPAVAGIAVGVPAIGRRVETLESEVAQLGQAVAVLADAVIAISADAGAIRGTTATVSADLTVLQDRVGAVSEGVERAAARLPDPDQPGLLEKAKDVFSGDDA
jgi:hypothetical protein